MLITTAPLNITLKLTNMCNLSCKHCHSKSELNHSHMPFERITDIVKQLRESRVFGVNLSGGEPLTHPKVFETIDCINMSGMRVTMSSNATLVDDSKAHKLFEYGIKGMHVSIDGSSPSIHDAIRNSDGCFEKMVHGIEKLTHENIPIMLVTVISTQSPEEYARIIDLAYSLGAKAHKTNALMPVGHGKDLMNNVEDKFIQKYVEVWKNKKAQYKDKMVLKGEMGFLVQVGINEYNKSEDPAVFRVGCPAGITTCAILENSKVVLCSFCPEVECGDLKIKKFSDVWQNSSVFANIRKRNFGSICNNCKHIFSCGGCRARAYGCGDVFGDDPFCWKRLQICS